MKFPLTEPTAPRYVFVNEQTNQVHVFMPIVTGTQIGLDNTCKSVSSLQEFFGKTRDVHQRPVLDELNNYKAALEFDLDFLADQDELKTKKQERLVQIKAYIEAVEALLKTDTLNPLGAGFPAYPEALQKLMKSHESNVHSMALRPKEMDNYLRFVNPVFSLKRQKDSVFYNALAQTFDQVSPLPSAARARLVASVLAALSGKDFDFADIQKTLSAEVFRQLNKENAFESNTSGQSVTKESIALLMGFDETATAKDYIDGLLGECAPVLFDNLPDESPFYTRKDSEALSIITQFFLASVNIHCRANTISALNFGQVLDGSRDLSEEVAVLVLLIDKGASAEDALLDFVNNHSKDFGLVKPLTSVDCAEIKQKFQRHFMEIRNAPHFDEFMLLDYNKPQPFITHQASICLNFAEYIRAVLPTLNPKYFDSIRADFAQLKGVIESTNPWIHASVELSISELLEHIKDEKQLNAVLKKCEPSVRAEILASPQIKRMQVPKFLHHVARGEQNEVESMLKASPDAKFLLQSEPFTDYSGRTFNCTAYEYAYWAKDTHMCRMLEKQMDDTTKAEMLKRCNAMERDGLTYLQDGEVKTSKHADLTPLISALDAYVKGYDSWYANSKWKEMEAAWMKVGIAQRDVPAHVAHEYCRSDRSFDPLPQFNEVTLPRTLTFYNWNTERDESWFPLSISGSSGLGVDFSLVRGSTRAGSAGGRVRRRASRPHFLDLDLAAVSHLDEVRTNDLTQSRENLQLAGPGLDSGFRHS